LSSESQADLGLVVTYYPVHPGCKFDHLTDQVFPKRLSTKLPYISAIQYTLGHVQERGGSIKEVL